MVGYVIMSMKLLLFWWWGITSEQCGICRTKCSQTSKSERNLSLWQILLKLFRHRIALDDSQALASLRLSSDITNTEGARSLGHTQVHPPRIFTELILLFSSSRIVSCVIRRRRGSYHKRIHRLQSIEVTGKRHIKDKCHGFPDGFSKHTQRLPNENKAI